MEQNKRKSGRRQYYQYTKDGRFLKQWDGCKEIMATYGVTIWAINQACKGQRKDLAGYKWSYEKT